MTDKVFKIAIERSRLYWDYYRSMFVVISLAIIAGMICTAIIYTRGEVEVTLAAGIIGLLFLLVVFLCALMSITIWRHENKHFDEILANEPENLPQEPPRMPLV